MKFHTAGLVLALSTVSLAHAIDDAAFARCRGMGDAAARLKCYDGLPMSSTPQAAPAAAQRTAPAASATAPAPAPAPAPAASARAPQPAQAAPAPQAQAQANFGMEERVAAQEQPTTLESTIPGNFGGWGPGSRIKLANGQVWQIVDGSSAWFNVDNPKIVVRRGMMGGFFLEVENSNRSPRVKRVQ